jgi:hypothetical protein
MKFMNDKGIDMTHDLRFSTKSTHGQFLNAIFIRQGASTAELVLLNKCRLFLRVSTMSDIPSSDGQQIIMKGMFEGHSQNGSDAAHWPVQPRPMRGAWKVWQMHLQHLVQSESTIRLLKPLGKWDTATPASEWQYNAEDDRLQHKHQ